MSEIVASYTLNHEEAIRCSKLPKEEMGVKQNAWRVPISHTPHYAIQELNCLSMAMISVHAG